MVMDMPHLVRDPPSIPGSRAVALIAGFTSRVERPAPDACIVAARERRDLHDPDKALVIPGARR